MRALVSVDFDFFVREEVYWDWGHRETDLYFEWIWTTRYASVDFDVRKETDPKIYADFMPQNLITELMMKGLMPRKNFWMATAESHAAITRFMEHEKSPKRPFDIFISIDAHHDMFKEPPPLDCGNWWIPIYDAHPKARHVHIYPRWLEGPHKPLRPIEQVRWDDFNVDKEMMWIDAMFACRSGCWVPPHLDPLFNRMVEPFSRKLKIEPRSIDWTGVKRYRKQIQSAMKEVNERT